MTSPYFFTAITTNCAVRASAVNKTGQGEELKKNFSTCFFGYCLKFQRETWGSVVVPKGADPIHFEHVSPEP